MILPMARQGHVTHMTLTLSPGEEVLLPVVLPLRSPHEDERFHKQNLPPCLTSSSSHPFPCTKIPSRLSPMYPPLLKPLQSLLSTLLHKHCSCQCDQRLPPCQTQGPLLSPHLAVPAAACVKQLLGPSSLRHFCCLASRANALSPSPPAFLDSPSQSPLLAPSALPISKPAAF